MKTRQSAARDARTVVGPRRSSVVALVSCVALLACAHTRPADGVSFRVETNVPDATVWIDDVLVGRATEWTAAGPHLRHLRAGFHRIEIRAPGYYSVFREINQPEGGRAAIAARLEPLLD